jgi:multiple sugar transport system permease protein
VDAEHTVHFGAATGTTLVCGLLAAYALARLKLRFAGSLGTGIFVT